MGAQIGMQTFRLDAQPRIISRAAIVGPKEGQGPLGGFFDQVLADELWEEDSWEKAESKMMKETMKKAIQKAKMNESDIRYFFAGDLLSQLMATTFAMKSINRPFFGVYGACSTMGESLIMASIAIEAGIADCCMAATSSHFCGAEKQFRFPLDYGCQRKQSATWTVTGSGSCILAREGVGPRITYATPGKIVDLGCKDANDMGSAMAPAAADTIVAFFKDTMMKPGDLDLIVTGDLGLYGRELVVKLAAQQDLDLSNNYTDCGILIFDSIKQSTNAGGSGCGCSAVTLMGYLLKKMEAKEINRLLFVPTGAMLSTVSSNEGETIPGIAHAVLIENM